MLGENEELVNIKTQDESKVSEMLTESAVEKETQISSFEPPVILIDYVDTKDFLGERDRSLFISGDVSSRVLIVRSTPIEMDDSANSKLLKTNQLLRCLSVPEEAVSETAWVKKKRCREAMSLIRRWLSDSELQRTLCRPECKLDTPFNEGDSAIPDCVFRTSNRSLKDTSEKFDGSVELLVNNNGCNVPAVAVEDFEEKHHLPVDFHAFTDLPSQRYV